MNPRGTRRSIERERIAWIERLTREAPSGSFPIGIGDDAASWRPPPGQEVVLTVDAQIEGTHFERGWLSHEDIGWRAVSSSVSDVAAMTARPAALLVSLILPDELEERDFRALYRGIGAAAETYRAPIVGGNISRGPLSVSVTAVGVAPPSRVTARAGARPGDELWVTGCPGLARLGLLELDEGVLGKAPRELPRRLREAALNAFRRPRARTAEGLALARTWGLRSAIDLSDGLATDVDHLLEASRRVGSRIGIELDESALATLSPLAEICRLGALDPVRIALAGGEDYELLVAVPPERATAARHRAFERRFETPLRRIGRVVAGPGVWLRADDGSRRRAPREGFEHFGAAPSGRAPADERGDQSASPSPALAPRDGD